MDGRRSPNTRPASDTPSTTASSDANAQPSGGSGGSGGSGAAAGEAWIASIRSHAQSSPARRDSIAPPPSASPSASASASNGTNASSGTGASSNANATNGSNSSRNPSRAPSPSATPASASAAAASASLSGSSFAASSASLSRSTQNVAAAPFLIVSPSSNSSSPAPSTTTGLRKSASSSSTAPSDSPFGDASATTGSDLHLESPSVMMTGVGGSTSASRTTSPTPTNNNNNNSSSNPAVTFSGSASTSPSGGHTGFFSKGHRKGGSNVSGSSAANMKISIEPPPPSEHAANDSAPHRHAAHHEQDAAAALSPEAHATLAFSAPTAVLLKTAHYATAGVAAVGQKFGAAGKFAVKSAVVPFQKTSHFVATMVLHDDSVFAASNGAPQPSAAADLISPPSISEIEEPKEEIEERPEQVVVVKRTVPIRSSPEEFTLYVLALRCFLRPLIHDSGNLHHRSTSLVSRLTFGLSDHLDVFRPSPAARLSAAQIQSMYRSIANALVAADASTNKGIDAVFVRSLRKFSDRIRFDSKALRKNMKDTPDDFRNMFKETLRMQSSRLESNVSEAVMAERMRRFESIVQLKRRSFRDDSKSPSTVEENNSELVNEEPIDLHGQDEVLMKVFGVSPEEHAKIVQTESFVQTDKVIIDEIKARLKNLDADPMYNKESFVHKTAAFIKWKKQQEAALNNLLRELGVQPEEDKAAIVADVPLPAFDGKARLVVEVLRARDLLGKDKSGLSDPYCLVECESQTMRTATIKANLNPVWEEQCAFDIKIKPGQTNIPLKLTMWDEDTGDDATIFKKKNLNPLHLLEDNKDDFLGQVMLDLKVDDLRRFRLERWFKLEKRSKRSHVNGEIFLRVRFVSSEKQQLQFQHQQEEQEREKEREKERQLKLLQQQQQQHGHDYHKLLKSLVDYIFKYELSVWQQTPAKKRGIFRLHPVSLRLLEEFGYRYGVSDLFMVLTWFERVASEFVKDNMDVVALSLAFSELKAVESSPDVRYTIQEQRLRADVMDEIEQSCLARLSNYKDYFPFSTPHGFVKQTIRALATVYSGAVFRERHDHAKDLGKMLEWCITNSCATMFQRFVAMSAPMIRPTNPVVGASERIVAMLDLIMRDIDSDAVYFREDFSVFDGTKIVNVDVVALCVAQYGKLLSVDIDEKLNSVFSGTTFHPAIFQIYHRLRKFNARNLKLVAGDDDGDIARFNGFPLAEMFMPFVGFWLGVSRDKALEWMVAATQSDKCVPISAREMHSSSVVDIFCMLNQFVDFLSELQWDDAPSMADFKSALAKIAFEVMQQYAVQLSVSLQPLLASYDATHGESMFKKDCRARAARQQLGLLYETLNADNVAQLVIKEMEAGVFKETSAANPAQAQPLRNISVSTVGKRNTVADIRQSVVRARKPIWNEVAKEPQPAIVVHFDQAAESVARSLRDLVDRLLAPLTPSVEKTLAHVLDEPGMIARFFSKAAVEKMPTADEVTAVLQPLTKHLTTVLQSFRPHVYGDIFGIMQQRAWVLILTTIENMVSDRLYTTLRPLDMLSQGIVILREFFQKDDGIRDDQLHLDRYLAIREVIELLRHRRPNELPDLYDQCVLKSIDETVLNFVARVIFRQEDRSCKEFSKTIRQHHMKSSTSYAFFSDLLRTNSTSPVPPTAS
ncbi:hypothetical protein CAOG_07581 [Capsaspora owczarzaki ATCC 30864]|uniref:C2 domain-containing protein n=1 Tax=Capsaspora owczarzaki (strain ATCC 30864) TaxID=595528 RepID=A0A0D2UQ51_CAPO3|nr:hypothetical protein CAOG_07581 [Capsaspora owczarzaki ATCC 30864]KJE97111.1 hypothetical protein CAOG_007581 [Capsaspora owczarzaki ATCC 30864]|eukprot:XP_004343455.2 hypothetical protein CAOG_07581 [Capsaspora owczarzaki ATCC 30864]